jgi:nucleotide-binding universal stress UspA family protein
MEGREQVIVCGIDGSPAAQSALEWALDQAINRSYTLRVVTAWSWDGLESIGAAASPAEAHAHAQQLQEGALARALEGVESQPEIERLLTRAAPSVALTKAALNAELLVLGSHGHGAAHDKLVGSTSQRAIHHSACPVVIVPDPRRLQRKVRHLTGKHRDADVPRLSPTF